MELGRCIACWDAAAVYAAYPNNYVAREERLYQAVADAAAPWGTARWIAVVVTLVTCIMLAIVALKREKEN